MTGMVNGKIVLTIRVVCLCFLLSSCGGGSGSSPSSQNQNSDPDENPPQCVRDQDCSRGFICSDSGVCESNAPDDTTPPSACFPTAPTGSVLYVAPDGSDEDNDGSETAPYATITHALDHAQDGAVILVEPGEYFGRINIRGTFSTGVTVRSQVPYMARLRNDTRVITAYTDSSGCSGVTIEGFDIAHDGPGAGALVVHLDAGGTGEVSNITLRNNILHDSYDNDILKINHGISDIVVERNLFYNQNGSDEHIDINSAENVVVQDNIFMNDFSGSGRTNNNDTSSYIVVKDSNGSSDRYLGSRNITIRRNIFLNWEGSTGSNFVLLGEDGNNYYEAEDVRVENNLMLGNSANVMRAAFGVKGCRNIVFNNNTVAGDLPALAFAMRFNQEGDNLVNTGIEMYNNIWSDPYGTMGATNSGGNNDFSDTPVGQVQNVTLNNNLYWNGNNAIPEDSGESVNVSDDSDAIIADPDLPNQADLILPRWRPSEGSFGNDNDTICDAFEELVQTYGTPIASAVVDQANAGQAPDHDILGRSRENLADIGAVEIQ